MEVTTVKNTFLKAIDEVCKNKTNIVENPKTMFVRKRKITLETLIQSYVSMGSGKTVNEITDCFRGTGSIPTESAWIQQRNKIKPEAIRQVFINFQGQMDKSYSHKRYRLIATDGSSVTFPSTHKYSDESYYYNPGNFNKGAYGIHVNAMFDLEHQVYLDAILQPVRQKDEFSAFCSMVDRQTATDGTKNIYIGDRGYCSYNTMAHVIQNGQYFLFRAKDINSKGITCKLAHPDEASFDVMEHITLVRYHNKQWKGNPNYRFLDPNATFDYITEGSQEEYSLSFRLVRFSLSDDSYECILTNLPADEFPSERIKKLYFQRWGIETSFRDLKYSIGLVYTHSYKPKGIMIEIFSRLLLYNFVSACSACVVLKETKERKYRYKHNFSVTSHICRQFLWLSSTVLPEQILSLFESNIVPIRDGRSNSRLQTAHFRRPHRSNYRPS